MAASSRARASACLRVVWARRRARGRTHARQHSRTVAALAVAVIADWYVLMVVVTAVNLGEIVDVGGGCSGARVCRVFCR